MKLVETADVIVHNSGPVLHKVWVLITMLLSGANPILCISI